MTDEYKVGNSIDIVGKVRFDSYKQQHYIDGLLMDTNEENIVTIP
jgi:hypothetical protein